MVTSGAEDEEVKYKGVRKRKWGKWVSEVRLPNSRERIWLGSYDSPAKAARAFDAAAFCLRGRRVRLNFPDDPPAVPTAGSLTYQQIQELAARHAHSAKAAPAAVVTAAAAAAVSAATPTEVETTAENSPVEEVVAEATAVDWSFLDMMKEGYPVIDEFFYDHMVLLSPTVGPADGAGEEGGRGVGMSSSLWNF